MPKGTNQKFKLYRLAQIMQENTDDSHYMTMPEIMVELKKYGITAEKINGISGKTVCFHGGCKAGKCGENRIPASDEP